MVFGETSSLDVTSHDKYEGIRPCYGYCRCCYRIINNENVTHVDGLDMSKGMVEGPKKLASLGLDNKIKLHIGDAQEIPFEDNQYNAVSMSFALETFLVHSNAYKKLTVF